MATFVPAPAGSANIAQNFARAGGLLGQGIGQFLGFRQLEQQQQLQQEAMAFGLGQRGVQTPQNLPPEVLKALFLQQFQPQRGFTLGPGQTRFDPSGQPLAQVSPRAKPPIVNTPRFFVKEFGFTPKEAQAAAEVARGIRPKTLNQLSSLELTRMAEVLQASASPAAFAVGQKIADIAAEKIEQELRGRKPKSQKTKGIARPKTQAEFDAILEGSSFIDTDGKRKIKR